MNFLIYYLTSSLDKLKFWISAIFFLFINAALTRDKRFLSVLPNPIENRIYQMTADLTSTCPMTEMNDHSASIG